MSAARDLARQARVDTKTWQFPSRAVNTSYQNLTATELWVSVWCGSVGGDFEISSDNVNWTRIGKTVQSASLVISVPKNYYYRITGGVTTVLVWAELLL